MNKDSSKSTDNSYIDYLKNWVKGIEYELSFWNVFVDSLLEKFGANNTIISLPEDSSYIEEEFCYCREGDKVLDVGSGAVPFYYNQLLKHRKGIDFFSVDPLAKAYKDLFALRAIKIWGLPETCFVEDLSSKFPENFFDVVHMSNSLDHSFDPVLALWQMLFVCKIGGYILLRHNCNEAEREKYRGFHQWNIDINGDFCFSRGDRTIVVPHELGDFVLFENMFKRCESSVDINFVCLKKVRRTPLLENNHSRILVQVLLDSINDFALKNVLNTENSYNEILTSMLKQNFDISKHIYVYGAGTIGKKVIGVLEKLGLEVSGIFDSNVTGTIKGYAVSPFSKKVMVDNSTIIIASKAFANEIETFLKKNIDCYKHIDLIKL